MCKKVSVNYFEILDLPYTFFIDSILDTKYYELQRKFHPDQKNGGKVEQINTAYKILKDIWSRTSHILKIEKIIIDDIPISEEVMKIYDQPVQDINQRLQCLHSDLANIFHMYYQNNTSIHEVANIWILRSYMLRYVSYNEANN